MASAATVTVFRSRRRLLMVYFVLGICFAVQGIATAIYFITSADAGPLLTAVMIALAAFIAFLGYWFGVQAWRRLRDPEAPITVGPAGLHDRALSARPIPWRDIRDVHVLRSARGGEVVVFDLAEEAERRAGLRLGRQITAQFNRRFGYGYQVYPLGTDASVSRLIAAIGAYVAVRVD